MQAIILAGGFGTRLRSVVSDLPKPMAPINGKPFLAYLIDYLKLQGITKITLSVHYLRETIQNYFGDSYAGIPIQYAIEEEPLGTGGAIVQSLQATTTPVFVLNGDTFVKLNYRQMYQQHEKTEAQITMALHHVPDCGRYGEVVIEQNKVIAFNSKGATHPGLINAGIYLLNPSIFANFSLPQKFSFEQDFLHRTIKQLNLYSFMTDDYFIDIGIPEDYARACTDLSMELHIA